MQPIISGNTRFTPILSYEPKPIKHFLHLSQVHLLLCIQTNVNLTYIYLF